MKKLVTLLLAAAMLMSLAACAKKEEPAPEPAATVAVPEELYGTYYEEIAGRGHFTLDENGIDCFWSSSASETTEYKLPVEYDEESNTLTYQNGVRIDTVFTSDTESTSTVQYEDGTGYFEIDGNKLIWHNDKEEGEPSTFVKDEGIANPWTYSLDVNDVIAVSGVEFAPPIGLPEGFELESYGGCAEGIIEAVYLSADRRMVVRKSYAFEGQTLSGNYYDYSENWNLTLKGVSADCYGDGETINEAHFSGGDAHYTVSVYNMNGDNFQGNGITPDDLNSLINGMQ